MAVVSEKTSWKLLLAVSTGVTAMVVHSLLKSGWSTLKDQDPPNFPSSPDKKWADALLWTSVLSVSIGLSQLIIKRIAAEGWVKFLKKSPPRD